MRMILGLGSWMICQWLIIRTEAYVLRHYALPRRGFALISAISLSSPVLLLLSVVFIFGGLASLPLPLIVVGVGIGAVNFVMGYVIAYFLYQPVFSPMLDYLRNRH